MRSAFEDFFTEEIFTDKNLNYSISALVFIFTLICMFSLRLKFAKKRNTSITLDAKKLSGSFTYLGEGAFGKVYKCYYEKSSVALKLFRQERGGENALSQEMNQLERLDTNHYENNIVRFYGKVMVKKGAIYEPNYLASFFFSPDPVTSCNGLVFEFAQYSTLTSYMKKHKLNINIKKAFCREITNGIKYLHDCNIVHQDLKPDNILIVGNDQIAKIADFGLARTIEWRLTFNNKTITTVQADNVPGGTPLYIAPEVFSQILQKKSDQCTSKSDIFSLGIIIWEIMNNQLPQRSPFEIINGGFFNQYNKSVNTKPFDTLIPNCLEKNPSSRPTADQILRQLKK